MLVTGFDVLLLLTLQNRGVRVLEALVITLIATVGLCFLFEIILSHPGLRRRREGISSRRPSIIRNREMLYIAIGILGATVMPHNLYLHSSIVQTRRYEETAAGQARGGDVRVRRLDHRAQPSRSSSTPPFSSSPRRPFTRRGTPKSPRSRTRTSC